MKKTVLAMTFLLSCIAASAQDIYSCIDAGDNFWGGTARSMAMGNAVTSVGGGLGSLVVNPAGSAVSSCSQVSFTPGVSISSTPAAYAPTFSTSAGLTDGDFTGFNTDSRARFVIPNGGFILSFDSGRDRGLGSFTFGFVASSSNSYLNSWNVGAVNDGYTCATGYLASSADGVAYSDYVASGAYSNYDLGMFAVNGVRSGAVVPYSIIDKTYVGASEVESEADEKIYPCGKLNQNSSTYSYGTKTDLAINFGFSFDRTLYLGFNVGIPILDYKYSESYAESLLESFASTSFDSYYSTYSLTRSGSGVYGKFGVIWLPVSGLRTGLSVQTPTLMNIRDSYSISGKTFFTGGEGNGSDDGSRYNSYRLVTPYSIGAGLSYTFGSVALVSADYELADFSVSRYSTTSGNEGVFDVENTVNKLFLGIQHNFRAGLEIKPLQAFAVRLGYGLKTSAQYYYSNCMYNADRCDIYASGFNYYDYRSGRLQLGTKNLVPEFTHSFSGGLGYSSKGSFFADLVLRCTVYPKENFVVYGDYIYVNGVLDTPSPTVRYRRRLWDVALTLGWRF